MVIMRQINKIIIHCADTPPSMDIGTAEIRQWHTDPVPKGRGWKDIGYHYVIRRNGVIEKGRDDEDIGAHVTGHNTDSIGICMVGGKPMTNFTKAQWKTLEVLVTDLKVKYPKASVNGHNTFESKKTCPTFDVEDWWGE